MYKQENLLLSLQNLPGIAPGPGLDPPLYAIYNITKWVHIYMSDEANKTHV